MAIRAVGAVTWSSSNARPAADAVPPWRPFSYHAMAAPPSLSCSYPAVLAKRSVACPFIEEPPALAILSSSSPTAALEVVAARRSSVMRLPTPSDLTSLTMPSLHCSFPALLHADYAVVKQPCDAWIEAVAEPTSASEARFLHDCLLPLLVCRFIPKTVSRRRLVHAIKAIAWLMIADDDDDHPDVLGSDCATTSHRANLVMDILHGAVDREDESSFDCAFLTDIRPSLASKFVRMLRALAELWHEIRQEMPPFLRARFISTMADYFEGLKVQASFREQGILPDKESYMEIRRQASFTIPCFILIEYALGIELDEATFYHPLIQELHNVALDYVSLCNDVMSCHIEIHLGDYFNLPSILYNSKEAQLDLTSFQSIMDCVSHMVQNLDNHAIFLISTMRKESQNFEPTMVPFINAYIDGLSHGMSGALAWFHETARYQQANRQNKLHQISLENIATLVESKN